MIVCLSILAASLVDTISLLQASDERPSDLALQQEASSQASACMDRLSRVLIALKVRVSLKATFTPETRVIYSTFLASLLQSNASALTGLCDPLPMGLFCEMAFLLQSTCCTKASTEQSHAVGSQLSRLLGAVISKSSGQKMFGDVQTIIQRLQNGRDISGNAGELNSGCM